MMNSQDNILQEDRTEEKVVAAQGADTVENQMEATNAPQVESTSEQTETPDAATAAQTDAKPVIKVYATKEEVLERVKQINHSEEVPTREEAEQLKMVFYKLLASEREAQQKAYLEAGGDPETYVVLPDETEEQFKAEWTVVKERRMQAFMKQEEEKQENLKRKLAIIERIKTMTTSPEEANKSFNEFKALQQEWKDIKTVPAEKANELWRNYQLYVEQYYDQLNLNREAREYDFKKNLELKTRLCEAAEKLADETDVISAFHQLQELHQQYREIGPVAKELREQTWARFKAASTVINKKHQQHFEQLRAKEEENLQRKTELCERVEALAKEENKGAGDWERRTKQIIEIQNEWKTIGFAPQKMNVKIFERFRATCDDFFARKAEFFKELKERLAENTKRKRQLVEKAKALQDSTEWRSTSDKLINLQKEWRTIGIVPKKVGDQLWMEFIAACNHFFDARSAANAGGRSEEHRNLDKKRDIIAQLKELIGATADNMQETVQQLVAAYNEIGHVPYKEKDKLYKEFHEVVDVLYKQLNISASKQRLDNFKHSLKNMAKQGENSLDNERGRLLRRYEALKSEITTYENNLGFLNASSKKGNSLIDEMRKKVEKLKDEYELVRQKIKAIDAENKA